MKPAQETNVAPSEELLAASLELSKGSWKIALHDGRRDKPALHTVASEQAPKRLADAAAVIEATKTKWGLSERARVVVVFEAGQDGFWIERALTALGYEVLIVDPASIPVARRARRAKTDRLDAIMLVSCLLGWLRGERDRMRKLLRTVGCWDSVEGKFAERLAQDAARCHDGQSLPTQLKARLERECSRLALAEKQLAELEAALVEELPEAVRGRIAQLMRLKAVGRIGAMRMQDQAGLNASG
ncbi:MAG: hypothetical protein Q7J38_16460 [Gallionella sp.]|nr:hypothetical protein [Gallionella sp.]